MRLFQARRASKKGMSQDNLLALLQDTGLCKVNDNMLHKEKFSSIVSSHGIKNIIVKSKLSQEDTYCYKVRLHACQFPSKPS